MSGRQELAALYHAVNHMMARLGAEGEVTSKDATVTAVMAALTAIDGGKYNPVDWPALDQGATP